VLNFETDFRRKSGELFRGSISSELIQLQGQTCVLNVVHDITERQWAQAALRESEERFRRAVLGAPFPIMIHAEDGEVVTINTPWTELTGYDQSDISTIADWTQKAYGARMDLVRADIDSLYALNGPKDEGEYTIMTRGGQARIWDFSSAPIGQLPDGRRLVISMAMDVTERKQAELTIRSLARFPAENPNPVLRITRDGKLLYANQAAFVLLADWKLELGATVPELLMGFSHEIFETQATKTVDLLCGERVFSITIAPAIEDDYVNLYGSDITERKQAEEALRETNEYLENLFNYANAPIIVWDPQFKITRFNHAFETLTGRNAVEVLGKPLEILFPPAQIEVSMEHIRRTSTGERWEVVEISIQHVNGAVRTVLWNSATLFSVDGTIPIATIAQGQDITGRKKAETALRDSQAQATGIFNSAMDAIITVDEGQKIIIFNSSAEQMFGCPASEAIGLTLDRFLPDYIRKEHHEYLRVFGQSNSTKRSMNTPALALTCLRANGEVFPSEVSISKIEFGGQKLYTAIVRDITERKQAEEKLIVSETRYRRLFEAARDGILILDAGTGMIVDVNPFLVEMLGFSFEEFQGKKIWELGFFKDIVANQTNFLELQQKEYVRYEDLPLETVNGRRIEVEFVSNVYQVNHHKVIQCNIRDITERKRAEAELAEHLATLKAIMESTATPVFSLDRDYRYTSFNKAHAAVMKALYGVEIEIDQSMLDYQAVLEDRETARINLDRALHGEQIVESAYSGEPGGTRRYFEITHNPICEPGGEVIGVSVFVSDTTERKQAEQALQEYSTRLETEVEQRTHELREAHEQLVRQERLATLGQLAGSVGHELRNPLGVISNAIYYLKLSQPNASDIVKEYLDIIENETRTSAKIVTDLLDFTRIKSVDREPVSVSELVNQTLERYSVPQSVRVVLEIPADLPQIYADPQHIAQVFGNLTTNAFQAMPEGGKVTISAVVLGDMICINIQDTGTGILPEDMRKLFEPLFTTKTKGIGLGLAVSKKLTEVNGGRIEVKSEPGKGTIFTLYLPVYKKFE
jgi:PAS domain S-box-containing protein